MFPILSYIDTRMFFGQAVAIQEGMRLASRGMQ